MATKEVDMNAAHRSLAQLFIVFGLAACGGAQEPSQPLPVEDTVFGDAVGTMDKARAVEQTLQQEKQAHDRALDAAEVGD
jgi:hypothetical protein